MVQAPIIKLLAVLKLTFIAINDNIDGLILNIGQLGVYISHHIK